MARLRQVVPAAVGLLVLIAALEVLRRQLGAVSSDELSSAVLNTPMDHLILAVGLMALNYTALVGYDLLAFASIRTALPVKRVALASLLAYAISNSVGFAMLSGASVRYRFYTRWGITAGQLSRIAFSYSVTFWLGLFALGSVSLAVSPLPSIPGLPSQTLLRLGGWLLMLVPAGYVLATFARSRPLRVRRFELPLPRPAIALGQIVISAVDWALAGAILYALLPSGAPGFSAFLGAFLVAILLGMISHVPGGVGVFEGLMIVLLRPTLSSAQLLPPLIVFRVVYYLVPFVVGVVGLVMDELWQRRRALARARTTLGHLTEQWAPRAMAGATFVVGLMLLVSGATPSAAGRLVLIDRIVPLAVVEASHFLSSVAGAALLILSQGLARRLDAAYYLATVTLVSGMMASLLKGFDYEEAGLLMVTLIALARARPAFDRRAALFETRFSPTWLAAFGVAIVTFVGLGLFAFSHVEYSRQLFWQFELHGDASRSLRATVGVAMLFLVVALSRLLGFARHEAPVPTVADFADAGRIIASQSATVPLLAYLGDKALLFDEHRSGFVMYAVRRRTWVALGDPVGPPERSPELIRLFLERCADFGGVPVFYEISKHHLHRYADLGFAFAKLGEEARVDLQAFSLDGGHARKRRQALRQLEREGASFRVVEPMDVPALLPQLRAVSDDWLAAKGAAEKGFSLGFFDDIYLERFPVAVVERNGRVEAFANLWLGAGFEEMSLDLMRYRRGAPECAMEALVLHVILWGRAREYRWLSLGMAPLAGVERSPLASLWNRLGAFVYEHGEPVYAFQGLRAYKGKFSPVWEPRYLAYPGGLGLGRILVDVSALVAGGYRRIFRK